MSFSKGDVLGPYEIVGPIGRGGMGEVYRARDSRLGRDVAIKVSAEQFSERFRARGARGRRAESSQHLHAVRRRTQLPGDGAGGGTDARASASEGAIPLEEALPSPGRSPTRSKPLTRKASFTAI